MSEVEVIGERKAPRRNQRVYDLQERIVTFAVQVCDIIESLPATRIGNHVASQLTRCATAPGPNYGEAQGAESRRDFIHKLKVCLKELRETHVWLQFIQRMNLAAEEETAAAICESDELIAIFVKSITTAQQNEGADNRR